jgi:hypothetical protein
MVACLTLILNIIDSKVATVAKEANEAALKKETIVSYVQK